MWCVFLFMLTRMVVSALFSLSIQRTSAFTLVLPKAFVSLYTKNNHNHYRFLSSLQSQHQQHQRRNPTTTIRTTTTTTMSSSSSSSSSTTTGTSKDDHTQIHHVFCYGSLRPDDDSGQSWTQQAIQGMVGQRAIIENAMLYHDEYASMVFLEDDHDDDNERQIRTTRRANSTTLTNNHVVHGWVLTCRDDDDNTHNRLLFQEKMKFFDEIEDIDNHQDPNKYEKVIAKAKLLEENYNGRKNDTTNETTATHIVGTPGTYISVYCYERPNCDTSIWIPSGDWLQRK